MTVAMEQENLNIDEARIGIVNYINTAPIHVKWKDSVDKDNWQLIEAPTSVLNRRLEEGQIDVGFISAFEYGKNFNKYKILSGLSVTASGPEGAVFLFSHVPIEQLADSPVLLSSHGETSVELAKIILEEFQEVEPDYTTGDIFSPESKDYKAVLAVGDEALKLLEEARYLYEYDLGDMWRRQTGLPFVLTVCATTEDFAEHFPELLSNIHRELLRCLEEGKEDLQNICEKVAGRIPLSQSKCHGYLMSIEHDLDTQKRKALEKYFEILKKREVIGEGAFPLKIFATKS